MYFWRGVLSEHRKLSESFFTSEYLRQIRLFEGSGAHDGELINTTQSYKLRFCSDWSVAFVKEGHEPDLFWEYLYPTTKQRKVSVQKEVSIYCLFVHFDIFLIS